MALEIKILDLGDVELESSFLVLAHDCGVALQVPVFGYLILGMKGFLKGDQGLDKQLAKHRVSKHDVGFILHTHLHIDHAGKDSEFPMGTVVVINRRELEFSVSGIMGEQYPAEYIKHLVDRLHSPGALRLLDLEQAGSEEGIPGVRCEAAGGHTEGSMNVLVDTDEGTACICGDVIYDIANQVIEPIHQILHMEPAVTGNHATTKRQEEAAIRKAVNSGRFLLPMHDRPAVIKHGRVVGRAGSVRRSRSS
jgi:glyoxylase-like metal-dependent hydrolase (beta-lactamase superfamily II)